jgi:hypothetical protein
MAERDRRRDRAVARRGIGAPSTVKAVPGKASKPALSACAVPPASTGTRTVDAMSAARTRQWRGPPSVRPPADRGGFARKSSATSRPNPCLSDGHASLLPPAQSRQRQMSFPNVIVQSATPPTANAAA